MILATGDKVFLRALAKSPECAVFLQRFNEKVLCLEQTLLWLITHSGFDLVKQKILPALQCDMAVQAAFGSGISATRDVVISNLAAIHEDLDKDTSGLLLRVL